MRFSVLASSSRANCTYVETSATRILVDCGISARQVCLRLEALGVDPESLDAIIVTHEHQDHIKGCSVLSRKFALPIFATAGTARFLKNVYKVKRFGGSEQFEVGDIGVQAFEIVHDATEPVGFVLSANGLVLGHATDMGRVTPLVRDMLRRCHALVLESNYDLDLLHACEYPWELKQRIKSSHGHLSNSEAAKLVRELMHYNLRQVVLAHLSENSNNPETALETMRSKVNVDLLETLVCGGRKEPTPIIDIFRAVQSVAA